MSRRTDNLKVRLEKLITLLDSNHVRTAELLRQLPAVISKAGEDCEDSIRKIHSELEELYKNGDELRSEIAVTCHRLLREFRYTH